MVQIAKYILSLNRKKITHLPIKNELNKKKNAQPFSGFEHYLASEGFKFAR